MKQQLSSTRWQAAAAGDGRFVGFMMIVYVFVSCIASSSFWFAIEKLLAKIRSIFSRDRESYVHVEKVIWQRQQNRSKLWQIFVRKTKISSDRSIR